MRQSGGDPESRPIQPVICGRDGEHRRSRHPKYKSNGDVTVAPPPHYLRMNLR